MPGAVQTLWLPYADTPWIRSVRLGFEKELCFQQLMFTVGSNEGGVCVFIPTHFRTVFKEQNQDKKHLTLSSLNTIQG